MTCRRRRTGFSLLEMIVVIFGISLLLGMLGSMIWAVMRIESAGTESFTRMQQQAQLADRFRDDVSQAQESPELAEDFTSSPMCMILKQGDGGLVIYRWQEGKLQRQVIRDRQHETQEIPVGGDDVHILFSRRAGVLMMDIHGPHRAPLMIAAALGGNRS